MTSFVNGQTLIQAFETWAPKSLAEDWDNVGLLVGTLNKPIKKVMVTLDVLENVVDEAIAEEIDLIFAHHPIIFRPLNKMLTDSGQSQIIAKCIKHDIAVYAAHTNLDLVNGGMNDWLAEEIGIQNPEILIPTQSENLYKLAVFVPGTHAESVRNVMGDSGAGAIGHYSHCTFSTEGKGTFKPGVDTNPFIGETGKLEIVEEVKIETIVPETQLKSVIEAMLSAHPYEEVAYDVYPLKNKGAATGLGRVGTMSQDMTLIELARHVKEALDLDGVRIVGEPHKLIRKVAVIGGDGNDFIHDALTYGADVLISGDLKYHIGHDALLGGLCLIDAGHHMEKVMKKGVSHFFKTYLKKQGFDGTVVIESAVNTNPFKFI
jgi:dinuclear metal center YbgI/SA1388 family protein